MRTVTMKRLVLDLNEDQTYDNVYRLIKSDLGKTVEEIEWRLDTSIKFGLDMDEVEAKLESEGYNFVPEPYVLSEWFKLASNLIGLHNFPLWFGMSLYFLAFFYENFFIEHGDEEMHMESLYIALVLASFILGFGVFSYYMDAKCEYYLLSSGDFVSTYALVMRNGVPRQVLKEELVVGDLLMLMAGDQLQADVKIVEATGMRINVSMLSSLVRHYYELLYEDYEANVKRGDVLLYSTYIQSGNGRAVVLRTRDNFVSRSKLVRYKNEIPSIGDPGRPLTNELNTFLHNLSFGALGIGFVFATSSMFNGYSWLEAITLSISIYVGLITEALLPTLNVCKAQISKDLAAKNCFIRNLNVLELLGRTSTVITRKTGVLTINKMILNNIWYDGRHCAAYEFMRTYRGARSLDEPLSSLVRCATLCNFAFFSSTDQSIPAFQRDALGKPTEVALLRFWDAFWGTHREEYRKRFACHLELPFTPQRMYSLGVYYEAGTAAAIVCIKGPPRKLIEHARLLVTSQGVVEFTVEEKISMLALCDECGNQKEKLIGFAQFQMKLDDHLPLPVEEFDENVLERYTEWLQFIGFVSMLNPVRLSVLEAVFQCRRAGIKVVMITGDHPNLAHSIASIVGLTRKRPQEESEYGAILNPALLVFTEIDLQAMSDNDLAEKIAIGDNLVFARISQDSKLRIARACRGGKSMMAFTGNGTRCLPLFEESDIRIALGEYGTDISKNNADIILLDDNFTSIVHGIKHGRVLLENVRKSLCYTLSSKTPEVLLYPMFYFFQIPKIGSSFTIIVIDLFTDNLPPIALAYEPIESHTMERGLNELNKSLTSLIFLSLAYYGLIQFLCGYLAYVVVMGENGFWWSRLVNLRRPWYSRAINDLEDSYGQEWTYVKRRELEYTCNTAYFVTIVIVRMAVLLCCRSSWESYLRTPFTNRMVNFSMVFVFFFALLMSYYPPFQYGLQMYPLKLEWWLIGVPFAFIMIVFDEYRKQLIRRFPNWVVTKAISY